MAKKKSGESKAEAIRKHLQDNPEWTPKDVAEAVGVHVSQVYSERKKLSGVSDNGEAKATKPKRKKRAARKAVDAKGTGTIAVVKNGGLTATELLNVRQLLHYIGGRDRLAEALEVIDKLK